MFGWWSTTVTTLQPRFILNGGPSYMYNTFRTWMQTTFSYKDNFLSLFQNLYEYNSLHYYLIVNCFLLRNYIFYDIFVFFAPLWSIDASIVFQRLLNWPLNRFFIGWQISKLQNFHKILKFKKNFSFHKISKF